MTEEETALAPTSISMEKFEDALSSSAGLDHYWRIAKLFAASSFVPEHFRGKPGDCLIAIEMALKLREHPLMLMQQSYLVAGRPGWKTEYAIGRANRSGAFRSSIRWRVTELTPKTISTGKFQMPNLEVVAYATGHDGEECQSTRVTSEMAVMENWTNNPKYRSMAEHMLRYRAAAFLIRQYCPEVMMGFSTAEELVDMSAAAVQAPINVTPIRASMILEAKEPVEETEIEVVPEPAPKKRGRKKKEPEPEIEVAPEPEPEPVVVEAEDEDQSEEPKISEVVLAKFKATVQQSDYYPSDVYAAACEHLEVNSLEDLLERDTPRLRQFWTEFIADPSIFGMVTEES